MLDAIKIYLTLQDAYLGIICLFPIATTLRDGTIVNKLLFGLLLVLQLCMLLSHPVKKKTLLALAVLAGNYGFMLCCTDFPLRNYNLLAYFPFFLLYTYFICDNGEKILLWLSGHGAYLQGIIAAWCAMVAVSALLPGCYQIREGGGRYFGSFCKDIFRLGPSAVFIQILILLRMLLHGKKREFAFMLVPMYCYLMGSSRTYLVIGFFLFVIGWYLWCSSRRWFWGTVLPLAGMVFLLMMGSALGGKIAYTLDENQYGDFWFRITSSRSYLWSRYWNAWVRTPLLNKLLGNHLEFTQITANRWAHNDFIEITCSFGLLGLGHYLYAVRKLFRKSWQAAAVPGVLRLCAGMVWLFNALFNMHYVYFCAMLAYPLLLLALGVFFAHEEGSVHHQHCRSLPGAVFQRTGEALPPDGAL